MRMRRPGIAVGLGCLMGMITAGTPAAAVPVIAGGQLSLEIGRLPVVDVAFTSALLDYTGGVLSVPAGVAVASGRFVPVTGFPLNLITGLVVTVSNGAGSFAPGHLPTGADLCPNGGQPTENACVQGGGFGGAMQLVGSFHLRGPLAIDVPIQVIGQGSVVSAGGIVVEGAPWTTGVVKVTSSGPVRIMDVRTGADTLTPNGEGALTLVTPAHVNAAGLARLAVFVRFSIAGGSSEDVDHDGVANGTDNCPIVANPDQADLDGDGLGNACDFDSDNDGLADAIDNCRVVANPDQSDTDQDLRGDACDNCVASSNTDQADFDADGIGDVCDADVDGDLVDDTLDNCLRLANGDQADDDGDGIGDLCDNCPHAANALQDDRGGVGTNAPADGIGDACQCGDVTGDGRITIADVSVIQRSRLVPPASGIAHPERCDVGGSIGCTTSDAVIVRRALLVPPAAAIAQGCAPTLP